MTRAEILDNAKKCVCGNRQCDYGNPEDNFSTIAKFWSVYKNVEFTSQDVALMMSLMKVARMMVGLKDDTFVDCAGYIACAGEIATRNNKEGQDK